MSVRTFAVLMTVLIACVGCTPNKKEEKKDEKSSGGAAAQPVSFVPSKEVLAKLEEADAIDGKKDHVVGKCYVCGLGMDGSEKFQVKVGDYTAHLCSKGCQKEFAASSESIIKDTAIPKAQSEEKAAPAEDKKD